MQYLINLSGIWLVSLVVFDLFLKKESYHAYNRWYLLCTLILGIFLPLWQWQAGMSSAGYAPVMEQQLNRVAMAKEAVVTSAGPQAGATVGNWLWLVYILGATVSLSLIIIDVVKLVGHYKQGHHSVSDGWRIVETGKAHAPFSFRNLLFVSSKAQYTTSEWQMILMHERRHTALYHIADLVIIQLCKVVFWFHPLVYMYAYRLLMVHEYQADSVASVQPADYGRFLVEQSILEAAPIVTHSFNRSPIKHRIIMLTRKSRSAAKLKMLVAAPVLAACIVCFSQSLFSQQFVRNGKFITYKGNKFELSQMQYDTVTLEDPVTGSQETKIRITAPYPVKMNGMPIPGLADKEPVFLGSDLTLRSYLIRNLKNELSQLPDGEYILDMKNIVVDEKGKIVYYENEGVRRLRTPEERKQINGDTRPNVTMYADIDNGMQQKIWRSVQQLIDKAPTFKPAVNKGKPSVAPLTDEKFYLSFFVKEHKINDAELHSLD